MKLTPAYKGLIISISAMFVAFAIYYLFLAKKNEYIVDNSSNKTYYFKLNNGEEQIIEPYQFFKVNLKKGNNRIAVFDANKKLKYDSVFEVKKLRGLINPNLSDYFVNEQFYGINFNKDSLLLANQIKIDGKTYFGKVKKHNRLYIDDFYYNLNEDYDKVIKNIDKVESRKKIYRKNNFIDYHNEYYKDIK